MRAYWAYRKRLDHYWIQPDFVLILHLIKRLINGSLHNDVAACSAWIPYRSGTDYVTVGTNYKAEGRGKIQLYK
ncbi:hypothetical protein [Neobacillus vireti]|uniref:hypothetical protein n=1 Tax=Neobacillus vireti TaxID=220686 RepID=UPI00128D501C|nr:hypothetical protein [Neobacillus vireti]